VAANPSEIRLTLPAPHAAQRRVLHESKRFNVLPCGRRWGKTVLGIDRGSEAVLRGLPVAWFAPSYKILADAWRELVRALRPVTTRVQESEHRLELLTGGVIEAWSLDGPDPARGRKYGRAILDECGLVAKLEEAWNGAIRPTLADLRGDAWFLGTPKGRNYFWQAYQRGLDPAQDEWRSWSMPTSTNPFIPADEIEAARRTTPDRFFRQEYLAEFLDDAGGVFRYVVERSTAAAQSHAISGHEYVMGVDWGKLADFSVFSVIDASGRCQAALDRSNGVEYQLQLQRLRALYWKFQPKAIIAERNSMGEPLIEQLQREGLPVQPFTTTSGSKADIIDGLALALERGDVQLLPDPVQVGELQAYEATRLPSGLMRYSAPEGMHDDTVMALAMAWHGTREAIRPRREIRFLRGE